MTTRPPIVVVMGHIDHGKTTLLDYIRKSNVAAREAGGITQAIGAYEITHDGKRMTFIDTPGHEAFSKMRAHGAGVADLAVLVVAADDGVKPQTTGALKHIQDAGIPYVVAITKTDIPNADIEKTKQSLMQAGIYLEGAGGNISYQPVSGTKGDGVSELLDLLNLAAELEEPTFDPDAPGELLVLQSVRDARRGILVGGVMKNGTLRVGDEVASASASGKVRSLENFLGENITEAQPSNPVLILGFSDLPKIGEVVKVGATPEEQQAARQVPSMVADDGTPKAQVILKAGESGSLEALKDLVDRLAADAPIVIIESGVGDIHETDIKLAASMGAAVIGFETKVDKAAANMAQAQSITLITSSIIYELEEALKTFADAVTPKEEHILEVLGEFGSPETDQQVVGGKVIAGTIKNQASFTVRAGEKEIGTGRILNLQSQKQDVPEIIEGQEGGMLVETTVTIKPGHHLVFTD